MGAHSSKPSRSSLWPGVALSVLLLVTAGAFGSDSPRPTSLAQALEPLTSVTVTTASTITTSVAVPLETLPSEPDATTEVGTAEAYGVPENPLPSPAPPIAALASGFSGRGLATIARGGAPLSRLLEDDPFVVAREGLVFPALGYSLDRSHIWLFTSCDTYAWVPADRVLAQPGAGKAVGTLASLEEATIVLDPGHGGPSNIGAVGKGSFQEKDVNLLIAQRVRDLLSKQRSVDWETGIISSGDEVAAASWVVVTRAGSGVEGDYEAGLQYRSAIANAIDADAMVSIHNNAGIQTRLDEPGSDVYYQSQLPESRRFAEIMVQEMERSFAPFEADWVGDPGHGAASRISARDGTSQYYGVLRRTDIPTVIAEGAYISNPSEAALLQTPAFQQAYADAVYRALVRFLTTKDAPEVSTSDPVTWRGVAGSGDAQAQCVIPSQP